MQQNKGGLRELDDRWLAGRLFSASEPFPVLVADDSEADIFFLLRAFQTSKIQNPIFVTRTGQETLDFLSGKGEYADRVKFPAPRIVFLDLYMPGVNGFDILRWKQKRPEYSRTLMIALTNSSRMKDASRAYDLGANTFLMKPLEASQVQNLIHAYQMFWKRRESKPKSTPQFS